MKISERRCHVATVTINGIDHELICLTEGPSGHEDYEFYIQPATHDYAMEYMFGVPVEQQSLEEAFDIAAEDATVNIGIYNKHWF